MADHSKPTITSLYSDFVSEMDARFDDLAVGLDPAVVTASNIPTNTIRWSSASNKWQKWNGSAWGDLSSNYDITVKFTPTGNISSTTVQAAIAELDNEKQPIDAGLTSIAALSTSADKMIYTTAADTYATTTLTNQARTFLSAVDVASQRSTLGLANHQLVRVDASGSINVGGSGKFTTDNLADGITVTGNDNANAKLKIINTGPGGSSFQLQVGISGITNEGLSIYDVTAGVNRAYLDKAGNLGLGVTPSAWNSLLRAIEGFGGSFVASQNNLSASFIGTGCYYSDGAWRYKNSGIRATYALQFEGSHAWFTAPGGTAGQPITFMQAMTLSTDNSLTVSGGGNVGKILINSDIDDAGLYLSDNNRWIRAVAGGALTIGQWGAERARFTNGRLLVGTTTDDGSNMLQVGGSGKFNGQVIAQNKLSIGNSVIAGTQASIQYFMNGVGSWNTGYRYSDGAFVIGNDSSGGLDTGARLTIDHSGNLGLGVTPSGWYGTIAAMQFGTSGSIEGRKNNNSFLAFGANYYLNSSANNTYIASAAAAKYVQDAGSHQWYTAPSGTAGNAITFTQAMTLNASGRLLLNKTNDDGVNIAQFNGTIAATTPTVGDNSTKVATTAFVKDAAKCRAWVNFNGTGTVSIRASFNVSSVTDTGNGSCTVNFTTAFSDVNYAPCLAYSREVNVQHGVGFIVESNMKTSSCEFQFFNAANSANATDKSVVGVSFFR